MQRLGTLIQSLGGRSGGSTRPEEPWRQDQAVYFTEEILKELGPSTPLPQRLKVLRELHDIVSTKRLKQYAVQAMWLAVKDLLDKPNSIETRHCVLGFLRVLISGQYEELGVLRAHFLHVVQDHTIEEDFQPCFDVVCTLTDSGKDILHMEQEMGPYLAKMISRAMESGRSVEYLTMVMNMIKHNAAYLDESVLFQIIHGCCQTATTSKQLTVTELSLESLNAVVCYSALPPSTLPIFITTLCTTLNISRLDKQSLEMMLRLLGTHIGHAAIYTLCTVLQERKHWNNPLVLRGAVFYISMSLWGVRKIESLQVSFGSVLPSFRVVSECPHTIVIYEVILSLKRLILKYYLTLQSMEWDIIYDILLNIKQHVKSLKQQHNHVVIEALHDLFKLSADCHSEHTPQSNINSDRFFSVVERDTSIHPISLTMKLVVYQSGCIRIGELDWSYRLSSFMRRFYQEETLTNVRILALEQLESLVSLHLFTYETELLEGVVLPLLFHVAQDKDPDVRCRAVQLLISILNDSAPQWTPSILAIINTVFQKGLDVAATTKTGEELKLSGSKAAVFGLTSLLRSKLFSSSDVSAQIYQLIVTYLLQQYEENCFVPASCVMRIKIFNCLLSLRANDDGFVGFHDDSETSYSPFYVCQRTDSQEIDNDVDEWEGLTLQGVFLDYGRVFSAVMDCLTKEQEWEVLVEVLVGLKGLLEDRTLAISSWSDFSPLCQKLCFIANNQSDWLCHLSNVPSRGVGDGGIAPYLYPILTSLCTYVSVLDKSAQHQLVCCLERGIIGTCGLLCVRALSVVILEMQITMTRLLPRVLYKLGQVSATPTMALPVLELLASTISLSPLYSGFVEQQYLGVFGIALPYTDPLKYNPYVVAMAHHVITMWFIRCRIQYRPTIAQFINKSFTTLLSVNQEVVETRQRSSSFSSSNPQSTSRQRSQTHLVSGSDVESHTGSGDKLLTDMMEVCVDMMARYTYSNISTQPIRSPGADFLVGDGLSKTWLIGNSLVTITTSGTGGGTIGVCPRCKAIKRSLQPNPDVLLAGNKSYLPTSRRMSAVEEDIATLCSCWCRGWAEIKVRRPTGNVAWLMRVQNKLDILATPQPTAEAEYDWSLMGINKLISDEEEEEEWDILKMNEDESVVLDDKNSRVFSETTKLLEHNDNAKETTPIVSHRQPSSQHAKETTPIIVSHRQPSSQSWSEGGRRRKEKEPSHRTYSLSSASLEQLPPLFSYDEGHVLGRSPSMYKEIGLLSEPEQLELMTSVSKTAAVSSEVKDENKIKVFVNEEELELDVEEVEEVEEESREEIAHHNKEVEEQNEEEVEEQNEEEVEEQNEEVEEQNEEVEEQNEEIVEHNKEEVKEVSPDQQLLTNNSKPVTSISSTSSPSRPRKRVMFQTPPSSSSIREDTPTDVFNNPAFIFLQLYHSSSLGVHSSDPPVLLPSSESMERAIKVLDHIPPYNTHKIGVVYVGEGQSTEQVILSNTHGSSRYQQFLKGLGQILQLQECPPKLVYLGGLDTSGIDGTLTCFWEDDITQVIFHVATLMPTLQSNPNCSNKKLHIGNDFVTIVYNDSNQKYVFGTIKGQFNYVEVVIEPLGGGVNHVFLSVREGLTDLLDCQPYLVSDKWLPLLARQKALLANLASLVMLSQSTTTHYPSNWLGRLRQIRHIREKTQNTSDKRNTTPSSATPIQDFTLYC